MSVWNLPCMLGWHRPWPHTCSKKDPEVGFLQQLQIFAVSEGFWCLFLYLLLSQNSIPLLPPWSQVVGMGLTPTLPQGLATAHIWPVRALPPSGHSDERKYGHVTHAGPMSVILRTLARGSGKEVLAGRNITLEIMAGAIWRRSSTQNKAELSKGERQIPDDSI